MEAAHRMEMARSFAALTALILIAALVNVVFRVLERRALAWWRG